MHITGVTSEILKNLVLAGVQPAICDGRPYPETLASTPCSFLDASERSSHFSETKTAPNMHVSKKPKKPSVAQVMRPVVHELNPLLEPCIIEERRIEDIPNDFFSTFDVVIASRIGSTQAQRIACATTKSGGKFYMADCFGLMGCSVIDLGPNHTFRDEIGKDKLSDPLELSPYVPLRDILSMNLAKAKRSKWDKLPPTILTVYRACLNYEQETGTWPSAEIARDFAEKTSTWITDMQKSISNNGLSVPDDILGDTLRIQSLASLFSAELSPVCAVLGGVIGNEVIKALSGKGEPANNVLLFDGSDGGCRSFLVDFSS